MSNTHTHERTILQFRIFFVICLITMVTNIDYDNNNGDDKDDNNINMQSLQLTN